jgi:transcriptional regulator with XRE-family HTH domain
MQNSNSRPCIAEFITACLAASDKSQKEIAEEAGFDNPNIISMLKTGVTKLPLNRVGPLAKALDIDPAHLFRLALIEYMPDTWDSLEAAFQGTVLTGNELALIRDFRRITGDLNPEWKELDREAILAIAEQYSPYLLGKSRKINEPIETTFGIPQLSVKFLLNDSTNGWQPISFRKCMEAYDGAIRFPHKANQTIRLATTYVTLTNGKPTALQSLSIEKLLMDSDGRVDQSVLMAKIIEHIEPTTLLTKNNPVDITEDIESGDLEAICSILGLPQEEHA